VTHTSSHSRGRYTVCIVDIAVETLTIAAFEPMLQRLFVKPLPRVYQAAVGSRAAA
jgi:hypothetical protein